MVEPPDPFQGRELDILMAAPGSAAPNHLRLEEADYRLGQCVVIRVTPTSNRGLDSFLGQAFGLDVTDEAFWTASLDVIRQDIEEFVSLVEAREGALV